MPQHTKIESSELSFTVKALADDEKYNIEAIATSFENEDKVGDIIKTGALDEYIRDFNAGTTPPLRILKMHDRANIIGEWQAIEVKGNNVILKGTILMETTSGKDTMTLIKKGLLGAVSIGFNSSDYSFDDDEWTRTFNVIRLIEASIVDNPANENAVILDVKSHKCLRVIEKALRGAGLSAKQAKAFISKGRYGILKDEDKENKLKTLRDFRKGLT